MTKNCYLLLKILPLFLLAGCAGRYFHTLPLTAPTAPLFSLEALSFSESWEGIFFKGNNKIGFSHLLIEKKQAPYTSFAIRSESVIRIKVLGIGKEVTIQDSAEVMPDLSLISFYSQLVIDEQEVTFQGKVEDGVLAVTKKTGTKQEEKTLPFSGTLYPSIAVNLLPVLKGMDIGAKYSYQVYNIETDAIEKVEQEIVAFQESALFDGQAFKVKTATKGYDMDIWINQKGETVLSMALNGILLVAKEESFTAKKFVADQSFGKSDMLLDFSLIRTDHKIPEPRATTSLSVAITGLAEDLIISDFWQKATIDPGTTPLKVSFTVSAGNREEVPLFGQDRAEYLMSTFFIESNHPAIIAKAQQVATDVSSQKEAVLRLVSWVSSEIEDDFSESFSALEVLKSKKGECQAHSYLYASLARALGIPTRLVSGLVYMENMGFLYHTWAESYVEDGWLPVDPTFNQVPPDATHIKLVEGEEFSDFAKIVKVIGKLKAKVLSFD